ncbi:MAG: PQQ-binding-like beta-propeller repeat protein [Chloroflexota bacterium]|nr:PQQ-binding-like beta-propeller repeat protein [Chloroflexota bacterium]
MKKSQLIIITLLLGLMLLLSACATGPRVTGSPGVAISDEYVFVAYGNFVYRLNAESGSVDWRFPGEASSQVMFYSQPLLTENFVYVGDLANKFHKIDIETGIAEWTFSEAKGYFIGQAAEGDGVIYAPSDDGNLYAINENGELVWSFKTGHYLWSKPRITEDVIYLGAMDHFVYAISKEGEEIWSIEMAGAVVGSPVLSDDGGTIYASSIGNDLVAIDTSNGEKIWSFEAEDSIWGSPAIANDLLYFADAAGNLYALDPSNGESSFQTEFEGSAVGGVTVLEDGIVLATQQGLIKAFNFDGSSKWEATLAGEIFQAPVANNEYLVVGTVGGENLVYAFNLSGVQRWSVTPEN